MAKKFSSYVKALPTPIEEMTAIGYTQFELFLEAYAPIYRKALCETVNHILSGQEFDKSKWNTYLQKNYGLTKRHANGIIADAQGKVDSVKECRHEQIKTLSIKIKSCKQWLKRKAKTIKETTNFYNKRDRQGRLIWMNSKTSTKMPLFSSVEFRTTNISNLRFQVHNKKRYLGTLSSKLARIKSSPLRVKVPKNNFFVVGSKDESCGNSISQWDGEYLTFRVPYCLENKFGQYVKTKLGNFQRNVNRLPSIGALTWHFYRKFDKWNACVQFTPVAVEPVSLSKKEGVIAIDINPSSIDWAEIDSRGNLVKHGKFKLQSGLPKGKNQGQFSNVCLELVKLAINTSKPIVHEKIDFQQKKHNLRDCNKKYSRMLSQWAYSKFFEILKSIAGNRGIERIEVSSPYTSLLGLVKYVRMYGVSSGVGAAIVIGRRAMRLSERLPVSTQAQLGVKPRSHNWKRLSKLNKLFKSWFGYIKRHSFYITRFSPNWECKVKFKIESRPVVLSTEF
jgi:IS605 OrfB family transposase